MIHQPLGGAQGQAQDIEIQAKEILFTKALLNKYIADYTDQPVEKIEEDCDRDFFMTPYEALDYGIIDEGKGTVRCVDVIWCTSLLFLTTYTYLPFGCSNQDQDKSYPFTSYAEPEELVGACWN
jgi:hypothetical protein